MGHGCQENQQLAIKGRQSLRLNIRGNGNIWWATWPEGGCVVEGDAMPLALA